MDEAKALKAQLRKQANQRYYLKNKATLSENRHIRYIEKEKPQAARKEFMKLLSELTD